MIVKIAFNTNFEVLKFDKEKKEIYLKPEFYGAITSLAWLTSTDGSKVEDYEKNKKLKGKSLFVSDSGNFKA